MIYYINMILYRRKNKSLNTYNKIKIETLKYHKTYKIRTN